MPVILPHDAGTELRTGPGDAAPGLDIGRYIHAGGYHNWEHYNRDRIGGVVRERTNQAIIDHMGDREFRAWAPRMSNHVWIDNTSRHDQTIEGFFVELYQRDHITETFYDCPIPHIWKDPTYEAPIVNPTETMGVMKTPEETALSKHQEGLDPSEYVRAPLQNETAHTGHWSGYTHLQQPFIFPIRNIEGNNVVLNLPNTQLLFAPQDWREPDRYVCLDADGNTLSPTEEWLTLRPGATYHVHLRPRNWRWEIFVLAHYVFVSLFGAIPNDEYFTHVYYDRPPFYPWRHNIILTKASQGYWNWNSQPRSYDPAIDYAWEHSFAAADLAHQMIEQQYSQPSLVYLFLGNEDPDVYLEAWAPQSGEIVAAIERFDNGGETLSTVFVKQVVGLNSVYPKERFGAFIARWQVVPSPWGSGYSVG